MNLKHARHVFCQLVLVVTLVACDAPVSSNARVGADYWAKEDLKNPCPESAQQYWKTFRSAVLKNDPNAVADMTHFPFLLSIGSLDHNRKDIYLSRKEFIALFPRLLPTEQGVTETITTMKEYVKAASMIPKPSKSCAADGGQFGVGNWIFWLKPEGWRFVQAGVDDEEFKP